MYIEPCCASRQLPTLLKEHRFCFFHTSGDVSLQKMLDACASLAGNGHTLLIAVAEVDQTLLRTMAEYLRRGWSRALLLVTQTAQTELVTTELEGYANCVQYAADPLVLDGMVGVIGRRQAVVLQGAVLGKPDFSLCQYAGYYGSSADTVLQAIDPLIAKLRSKSLIDVSEQCADVERVMSRQLFD